MGLHEEVAVASVEELVVASVTEARLLATANALKTDLIVFLRCGADEGVGRISIGGMVSYV